MVVLGFSNILMKKARSDSTSEGDQTRWQCSRPGIVSKDGQRFLSPPQTEVAQFRFETIIKAVLSFSKNLHSIPRRGTT